MHEDAIKERLTLVSQSCQGVRVTISNLSQYGPFGRNELEVGGLTYKEKLEASFGKLLFSVALMLENDDLDKTKIMIGCGEYSMQAHHDIQHQDPDLLQRIQNELQEVIDREF